MGQSTYMKTQKKEEKEEDQGQLPAATLNVHTSIYNMKAYLFEDEVILDEFEGVLGNKGDENLPRDVGAEGMEGNMLELQLSRSYMPVNWEDEFSPTQLLEDADLWDVNENIGIKAESRSGYWDSDEKKTSLNLSLNHGEVLEAWSNRGSLQASSENYMGEVPVMEEERMISSRRQASVMRYKEKRQNRLFSKKIRYEVRKLNADKRPRIKGRFVKRVGDKMQRGS